LKLHLDNRAGVNTFTGYGPGYVSVNGARHDRNLVVLAAEIIADWAPGGFDSLSPEHLAPLAERGLEIVLIGTGTRLRFPPPEILRPLIDARIGVEVMDVQAACRTYNILAAESRKVAAALLLAD
jgi:uncharacterized protein